MVVLHSRVWPLYFIRRWLRTRVTLYRLHLTDFVACRNQAATGRHEPTINCLRKGRLLSFLEAEVFPTLSLLSMYHLIHKGILLLLDGELVVGLLRVWID